MLAWYLGCVPVEVLAKNDAGAAVKFDNGEVADVDIRNIDWTHEEINDEGVIENGY